MGRANFERHIAKVTPLEGKSLKGPDQAAMQARERLCSRDRAGLSWAEPTEAESRQRERDWRAVGIMERRKHRGGQTYRHGEIVSD